MSIVSSIIRGNTLEKTRWKNGRGVTREIARSPSGSSDYDWRLSFAEIDENSPFSEFPGYERLLVIWSGPGLDLDGTQLLPYEPFQFSGETPRAATLVEDTPVRDLGLIYRRGLTARFERQTAGTTQADFLFVTEGSFTVDGERAEVTDTVVRPRVIEGSGVGIAIYLRGIV